MTAKPAKKWTGKGEGKEKSAGVATAVKSAPGGITYVEWSYAKDNKLGIAQIDNGGGPVELTQTIVGLTGPSGVLPHALSELVQVSVRERNSETLKTGPSGTVQSVCSRFDL